MIMSTPKATKATKATKARRTDAEVVWSYIIRFLFLSVGSIVLFLGTVMILPEGTPMGYCFTVVGFFVLGVILLVTGSKTYGT